MHFIGMSAVTLYDTNHIPLDVYFRIDLTLTSLAAVLIFTFLGLWIGSRDKAFVQDNRDIIDSFIAGMVFYTLFTLFYTLFTLFYTLSTIQYSIQQYIHPFMDRNFY
jgi:NO-binding membrane sensor protein with MHYT domain